MKFFTALLSLPLILSSVTSAVARPSSGSLTSLVERRFVQSSHKARAARLQVVKKGLVDDLLSGSSSNSTTDGATPADVVGKIQVFQNGDSVGYLANSFTTGSGVVSLTTKAGSALTVRYVAENNELRIWNSAQAANYPVLGIASVGDETVSDNIGKGSAQIGALTFTKKSDSPAAVGNLATKKDTESTSSCWTLKASNSALTGSWGSSKLQFFLLQDHVFVSGDISQTEEHYQQSVSDDVLTFAFVQN